MARSKARSGPQSKQQQQQPPSSSSTTTTMTDQQQQQQQHVITVDDHSSANNNKSSTTVIDLMVQGGAELDKRKGHIVQSSETNSDGTGAPPSLSSSSSTTLTSTIHHNDNNNNSNSNSSSPSLSKLLNMNESQMVGLFWLSIWFVLNVLLALLNKYIFKSTPFNYPVLLSFIHMVVGWIMSVAASKMGLYQPTSSSSSSGGGGGGDSGSGTNTGTSLMGGGGDHRQKNAIRLFILIFCLNIAFGNISVQIVNLAASQVVRSTTPLFMIAVAYQLLGTMPSTRTILSVLPIVLGVALTVVGDVDLNLVSLIVLFIGNLLAALKVVLANKYINQYKLHPLDLLKQLSPSASVVMFIIALIKGEVTQFYEELGDQTFSTFLVVLFTGVCAFSLNWTNMMANKYTSPLTMSVTANVKQVFLVGLSIFIYNVPMNFYNTTGISIALLGMFYYSYLKTTESSGKK